MSDLGMARLFGLNSIEAHTTLLEPDNYKMQTSITIFLIICSMFRHLHSLYYLRSYADKI